MTPPVMKINFRLIRLFLTALLRFLAFDCTLDFVESPFYSFFKKNFGDSSFIHGRLTETLKGGRVFLFLMRKRQFGSHPRSMKSD